MERLWLTVLVLALGASPAVSAEAQFMINCDQGLTERIYEENGKPAKDEIGFAWFPELVPEASEYVAVGFCRRGNSLGNNKTKFSGATLVGVDSGRTVSLPKKTAKMKNGWETKSAIWEITEEARELAGTDSVILGYAKVKMNKTVEAGDYTGCAFGLIEMDSMLLVGAASAVERRFAIEELIRLTIGKTFSPPVR